MRRYVVAFSLVAAVLIGVGLYLFEPWQLWVDTRVDEPIPTVLAGAPDEGTASSHASSSPGSPEQVPTEPVLLAAGELISHEHTTTGQVLVLELADGSRIVRLEDLDTSSGPDLKVWITDAPVIDGSDGWHVFDDGGYVDLGELKANHGNQNYVLPASVDLDTFDSVSIWCNRFSVSFGAAALT